MRWPSSIARAVIRQGPISQLLAGSSFEVQVECSEPARARTLLEGTAFGSLVQVGPDGLEISLPEDTQHRDAIAGNRSHAGGRRYRSCTDSSTSRLRSRSGSSP